LDLEKEFEGFSLRDRGYGRYTCRKCGAKFWSVIPRDTCPDRPCSRYEFLYKKYPSVRSLSLEEAREKFIEYFKSRDHGYIEPYPVLARWRNDLYLTIASIVVFQPMVTDGVVEPPYNPLVIVQPSVRLEDIDNVGLTFGRHLTSFEMGGHHAFNKEGKQVYWIKETVEYALEFFTKEIGIPEENIVFKESWWEGGGNAGPAFEVLVDGIELATLVFMKHKVVNNRYEPNPVYVVDTGYGIERIAWFTQRKPTAYHVIFDDLLSIYKSILGVEEPPYDVLKKIVYLTSDHDIKNINELTYFLRQNGFNEYIDKVLSAINLYTALDHGKTILLLLSDGIVPSNTGEGYLARLVIRRLLRTLLRLGVEISQLTDTMLDLLERQAVFWRNKYVYNKFYEKLDYILDVVSLETRKFIDNITRGVSIVDKIIKKKKTITEKDLIEIYDSQGIPPEIVAERASKHGIKVNVPPDFYSKIAEMHGGSGVLVKEKEYELPQDIVDWALKHKYTGALFHKEPYKPKAIVKVLDIRGRYVVFDKTIFYPKAGGQDHDIGYIVWKDQRYNVVRVYKVGDVVVHELDREPEIPVGEEVEQHIDWIRRYRLMRHHTATHIILGVARKILGDHVWQAGAEKTVEKARLDITHYKMLTNDEIKAIEQEANRVVDQHINLKFHYLDKFDAEKKYGLRIYQGGAVYSPILRIVEIPGVDAEACFGVHVDNTAEVGGIKILKAEKIQDGVIRLEFTVATRLPEYIDELIKARDKALEVLGEPHGNLLVVARKTVKQLEELKSLIRDYRRILYENLLSTAMNNYIDLCGIKTVFLEEKINDKQLYRDLIEELALKNNYLVVFYGSKHIELAINPGMAKGKKIDLRNIVELVRKELPETKGGGKPDHVTLKINNPKEKIGLIKAKLETILCKK